MALKLQILVFQKNSFYDMGGKKKKLFHETQKTTKLASELSQRPLVLIPGGEAGWGKKVTGSACNGLEQGLGSQSEIEAGSQW